jgi:ATP-dependent DNA helicase RecG
LHIPRHVARQPVIAHMKAWQRSGESLIELTQSRKTAILSESLQLTDDWSSEPCLNAGMNQLSEQAIDKARANFKLKNPRLAKDMEYWDTVEFLTKTKLFFNGVLTKAAILLLGKPESTVYLRPISPQITWVLYNKEGVERDYSHFEPPYILALDEVFAKIRNLKFRYLKEGTLFPEETDQYDPENIKEALSNCIAHMDYRMGGRITVSENEDGYLTFTNPGDFLPGSISHVLNSEEPPTFYRNTLLVKSMESFNMIDSIGKGIKRMFKVQRDRFFPMPDFDIGESKVKVTLTGKVLDLEYARILARNPEMNLTDIILLDKVQKRKTLTKVESRMLRDKGLIEGKSPSITMSARLAQTTGQKATYTLNKAFQKEMYLNWIVQGIRDHGFLTRKDIENLLWDRLSDLYSEKQKKVKVNNLISELRKANKIRNTGSDSKPVWVLIE